MSASRAAFQLLAGAALVALLAAPVQAAGPSIGKLGVGGTGCPAGTVSASLAGGGTVLSLKFSKYSASAGGARSFDRKACGIAIPFSVPPGKSVAIVGVQYKGRSTLPAGAKGTISAEIFFAGGKGPVVTKSLNGPSSGPFSFTTGAAASGWSACGADLNLRINSSIRVNTAGGKAASISVRSQDVAAALVYQLKFKDC